MTNAQMMLILGSIYVAPLIDKNFNGCIGSIYLIASVVMALGLV